MLAPLLLVVAVAAPNWQGQYTFEETEAPNRAWSYEVIVGPGDKEIPVWIQVDGFQTESRTTAKGTLAGGKLTVRRDADVLFTLSLKGGAPVIEFGALKSAVGAKELAGVHAALGQTVRPGRAIGAFELGDSEEKLKVAGFKAGAQLPNWFESGRMRMQVEKGRVVALELQLPEKGCVDVEGAKACAEKRETPQTLAARMFKCGPTSVQEGGNVIDCDGASIQWAGRGGREVASVVVRSPAP